MGLSLLLSACGESSVINTSNQIGGTPTTTVTCPASETKASWHLIHSDQLTIASDTTYIPGEFVDTAHPTSYSGYDMDIARELARRLCLHLNIVKTNFNSIIPNISGPLLGHQRSDMAISSIPITKERKQLVDMIPYFQAGESILTTSTSANSITSIADMCGKSIAVQDNTIEKDEILDANGLGDGQSGQAQICKSSNQIQVLNYDDEAIVVEHVLNGTAQASYQDQPMTDYYSSLHQGHLVESGVTVMPTPDGIVVRNDNVGLERAITTTLTNMDDDGTYLRILMAWGVQELAYSSPSE